MEFLKELFTEPLSYEAFVKAVNESGIKLADLSKGAYVAKDKLDKVNKRLETANETISTMTTEMQGLKESGATAAEWKEKYDKLAEEQRKANEERQAEEKETADRADFEGVAVGKDGKPLEWSHEAIKESYFRKYVEAKASPEYQGKTGADIFHLLTKDDGEAFKKIQPKVNLPGASPLGGSSIDRETFAKMGYKERVKLYNENKDLYENLTSKGE